MTFRDSLPTADRFPSPATVQAGLTRVPGCSPGDGRCQAREPLQVTLIGKRASDGKMIKILIYKGGHTETKEM